eukprot:TRINITY_DN16579_c0_g1_i1.p1 TRINITY_DN16579_c0_g1~~TRINITY_DN16579_c0_g1_i1.p1  ORF type:complete len:241 (+),score=19.90 TRINITY_DN16579_c0_g1_i1:31-723(+)
MNTFWVFLLCTLLPVESQQQNRRVHAFYYLWYGNPAVDGKWLHWNHAVLPHWDKTVQARYPETKQYSPPNSIHSAYYPLRGCYSSRNASVVAEHMQELTNSGVGVVVLSWWGRPDMPNTHDTQGVNTDDAIRTVLDAALSHGMEVSLHLEPYQGRNVDTLREDLSYLHQTYGAHAALHRSTQTSTDLVLPVFYIYDSYHIPASEWSRLLQHDGDLTVRGTAVARFSSVCG